MGTKRFILFLCLSFFSKFCCGQFLWDGEYKKFSVRAGANFFDIGSKDVLIEPNLGWTAGFTAWDALNDDFNFVYGVHFFDFKMNMNGREKIDLGSVRSDIPVALVGIQGNILASYELIEQILNVQMGPVLQFNGRMDVRQDKEYFFVQDYNINAIDFENISSWNFNLAMGVSGGFRKVRIWIQYQTGLNNILKKLKESNLESKETELADLSGRIGGISGGVFIFL